MAELKYKQPNEILDFDIDAYNELDDGDAILNVQASYEGPDRALVIEKANVIADTRIKIWTSGGTDGEKYLITIYMVTRAGRLLESEFTLSVRNLK